MINSEIVRNSFVCVELLSRLPFCPFAPLFPDGPISPGSPFWPGDPSEPSSPRAPGEPSSPCICTHYELTLLEIIRAQNHNEV